LPLDAQCRCPGAHSAQRQANKCCGFCPSYLFGHRPSMPGASHARTHTYAHEHARTRANRSQIASHGTGGRSIVVVNDVHNRSTNPGMKQTTSPRTQLAGSSNTGARVRARAGVRVEVQSTTQVCHEHTTCFQAISGTSSAGFSRHKRRQLKIGLTAYVC
jgi:hypothetical protein